MSGTTKEPPFGWLPGKEQFRPLKYLFDCARFKINLRITCRTCQTSRVIDAPGYWWDCYKTGKEEHIAPFVKRLVCATCKTKTGKRRRNPKVEPTRDAVDGPLLPGSDHYKWKRFISGQRR